MSDNPLKDFDVLNARVSIYQPTTDSKTISTSTNQPKQPSLIVICSWVGAAPKHIAKYITAHRGFYPNATILLIQSTVKDMFTPADLNPALDVVKNAVIQSNSNVILHAFSNGGTRNASLLITALAQPCPFTATIFDSAPGTAELLSITRAIILSLPLPKSLLTNPVLRILTTSLIYTAMALALLYFRLRGVEDSVSVLRRTLNDPSLVPRTVPRLYLFSRADGMVRVRDVRAHAEDARRVGYGDVREEEFASAAHCNLVAEDGGRYWGAVRGVIGG